MSSNSHRIQCPSCRTEFSHPVETSSRRGRRRWYLGWIVLGLVMLAVGVVGYRYKGQILTVIDLANEITGSTTLSLAAMALTGFVGLCVVGWLVLPLLAAWAYLDLCRRLGTAAGQGRICDFEKRPTGESCGKSTPPSEA